MTAHERGLALKVFARQVKMDKNREIHFLNMDF